MRNSTRVGAASARARDRASSISNEAPFIASSTSRVRTAARELRRRRARAPCAAPRCPPQSFASASAQPRRRGLERDLGAGELRAPRAAASRRARAPDAIDPPCLRSRRSSTREALLDGLQAARARPRAPRRSGAARRRGRRPRSRAPASARRARRARRRCRRRRRARGPRPTDSGPIPPSSALDRLGSAERRAAQRLDVAQPLALGAQLDASASVGAAASISGELEVEQVELALARARRARAARPARAPSSARRRAPPPPSRGARRCASPQKPSRISSCAPASVSRRCSCWP